FVTAALQRYGKIFVAASEAGLRTAVSLARLNPDGTLDANFNVAVLDQFGDAFALPDGRILLVAADNIELLAAGRLIVRLKDDGFIDTSFQLDSSLAQAVMDPNTRRIAALYAPGPKPL